MGKRPKSRIVVNGSVKGARAQFVSKNVKLAPALLRVGQKGKFDMRWANTSHTRIDFADTVDENGHVVTGNRHDICIDNHR